jgi:alpha-L-rhamnosidase
LEYGRYGDWVEPRLPQETAPRSAVTPNSFVSSAYLFWHTRLLSKLAGITGRTKDKRAYAALSAKIRAAFNAKYFDAEKCAYATNSQGCNSIALSLGLCGEKDRARLARHVADDIKSRGWHHTTGNQSYRHMFYAVSGEGYTDVLLEMLLNPEYPGWGYMLACGATTVWERWESEMQKSMNSFCHPMFASYDGWLYNKVAGISVAEDCEGARKLVIAPCVPARLTYAYAALQTIHGRAVSRWEKSGGKITYEITVPPNVTADITVAGKILSVTGEYRRRKKDGKAVLIVGGGNFVITADMNPSI